MTAQAEIFNLDDDELTPVVDPIPKSVPLPIPIAPPPPTPVAPVPIPAPTKQESSPPIAPVAPKPADPSPPATIPAVAPTTPPSPEYILYRTARAAFLKADYKTAFVHFNRLCALAKVQKAKDKNAPVSPFAEAARLYREQCRLAAGDAKDKARALGNLKKFCEDKTSSLYRGEAMLLLAQERMLANDRAGAWPWLVKLEHWLKDVRAAKVEEPLAMFPKDWHPQLIPVASPWEKDNDAFNNPVRRPLAPQWVVNEQTAPWYLDELEVQWAKDMGCLAMLRGDSGKMKICWRRAAQLEPAVLPPKFQAKPGEKTIPTDAFRLELAAKQKGLLLAYPGEEYLLNAHHKAKERVMYAEYLYLTQDFDKSIQELREVLAADDADKAAVEKQKQAFAAAAKTVKGTILVPKFRAAGLTDAQRDYVLVVLGEALYRRGGKGDRVEVMRCFEEVFKQMNNTVTERRTVLGYLNVVRWDGTEEQRKRAAQMESALLASPVRDDWSRLARLFKAAQFEDAGRKAEAYGLWAWNKPTDGMFYKEVQEHMKKLKPPPKK